MHAEIPLVFGPINSKCSVQDIVDFLTFSLMVPVSFAFAVDIREGVALLFVQLRNTSNDYMALQAFRFRAELGQIGNQLNVCFGRCGCARLCAVAIVMQMDNFVARHPFVNVFADDASISHRLRYLFDVLLAIGSLIRMD
jgi:hypothetical protein